MKKSPVRILVLTSSTGGGHDARAHAFELWCKKLYGDSVDVRVERPLEKASLITHFGVGIYNFIQKHAPYMHNPYWLIVEGFGVLQKKKLKFGNKFYRKLLEDYQPHLVFSVHDFLNRGYFQMAREVLDQRVRCSTYCGEFSGGFGYSKNWVEPTADMYFSRTATAQDYAISLGMAPKRCRVRGHLMNPEVYDAPFTEQQKRDFIVNDLGLSPKKFTIFLTTGSVGANSHIDMLKVIRRYASRVQAIMVCGKNSASVAKVREWQKQNPEVQAYIEGYSRRMHQLIQVSNAIVSRGATTCAEALHFGVPILFSAIGGIMPQERLTFKYFYRAGAAVKISNMEDLNYQLGLWLSHKREYELMRQRCQEIGIVEDPTRVIRELVDLAQQAADQA